MQTVLTEAVKANDEVDRYFCQVVSMVVKRTVWMKPSTIKMNQEDPRETSIRSMFVKLFIWRSRHFS